MSFPVSALYSELSASCVIECCAFGSFATKNDLIVSTGDRLVLYSVQENGKLLFVSETLLSSRTHDIAVIQETSLLIVAFRHGHVAAMTFDLRTMCFSTKSVVACGEGEGAVGKLRVCGRTGAAAALQSTPETLSILSITGETVTLVSKLSVPSSLGFAVLTDFGFSDDPGYGKEVVLGCVGQVKAKCWVGRKDHAKAGGAVKVFSVSNEEPVMLWELLSLPNAVFRLLPLSIGWLCLSPDAIIFSAEFADAVGFRVNDAEWELGGLERLLPLKACFKDDGSIPLQLDGCGSAVSDQSTVVLSLSDGTLLLCDMTRNPNGIVSDISCRKALDSTWAQSIALSRDFLFLGSRLGDSFLHPIVNQTRDSPMAQQEQLHSGDPLSALLSSPIDRVSHTQPPVLTVLSHTDVIESCGLVRHISEYDANGLALLSCGAGDKGRLALVSPGQVPADEVVSAPIPDACKEVLVLNSGSADAYVLLSLSSSLLVVDVRTGVKAVTTLPFPFIAGFDLGSTQALLVTTDSILILDISTMGTQELLKVPDITAASIVADSATDDVIVMLSAIGCYRLSRSSLTLVPININDSPVFSTVSSVGEDVWAMFALRDGSVMIQSLRTGATVKYFLVSALPPVLTTSQEQALAACSSSLTDPSAPAVEVHPGAAVLAEKAKINLLHACLMEHGEVKVPVLFVGIEGRPLALYRAEAALRIDADLLGFSFRLDTPTLLHSRAPILPVNPCAPRYGNFGASSGLFIGGVFITLDSRGQLFACSTACRGDPSCSSPPPSVAAPFSPSFSPNSMLLIDGRRMRVMQEYAIGGDKDDDSLVLGTSTALSWSYTTRQGPQALVTLPGVPYRTSCSDQGLLAVAVARREIDAGEQATPVSIVAVDEDAEDQPDESVLQTISASPAVETGECAIPRMRLRFEVLIFASDMVTVLGTVTLEPDEQVTGLDWLADDLMIGTGFQSAEDSPGRGRVLAVKRNGTILVASEKKTGVTCLRVWRDMIAVGLGWKLMLYRFNKTFSGCGMYDVAMHTTAVSFAKQYILAGDLLRGLHFLQFREDPDGTHKNVLFLAKSTPFIPVTILGCECVQLAGAVPAALGLFGVDDRGNLHVLNFSLEAGVTLRQCAPFSLDSVACIAARKRENDPADSALISLTNGTVARLTLMTPPDFHLAASLASVMITLLPFSGGINPRLAHSAVGSVFKKQVNQMLLAGQGVESGRLLQQFLWLAVPLQAEIAERVNLPVDLLCELIIPMISVLFAVLIFLATVTVGLKAYPTPAPHLHPNSSSADLNEGVHQIDERTLLVRMSEADRCLASLPSITEVSEIAAAQNSVLTVYRMHVLWWTTRVINEPTRVTEMMKVVHEMTEKWKSLPSTGIAVHEGLKPYLKALLDAMITLNDPSFLDWTHEWQVQLLTLDLVKLLEVHAAQVLGADWANLSQKKIGGELVTDLLQRVVISAAKRAKISMWSWSYWNLPRRKQAPKELVVRDLPCPTEALIDLVLGLEKLKPGSVGAIAGKLAASGKNSELAAKLTAHKDKLLKAVLAAADKLRLLTWKATDQFHFFERRAVEIAQTLIASMENGTYLLPVTKILQAYADDSFVLGYVDKFEREFGSFLHANDKKRKLDLAEMQKAARDLAGFEYTKGSPLAQSIQDRLKNLIPEIGKYMQDQSLPKGIQQGLADVDQLLKSVISQCQDKPDALMTQLKPL